MYTAEVSNLKQVDCGGCGNYMEVSIDATGGTCSRCTQQRVIGLMSDSEREKLFSSVARTVGTGRPRGWRWRKEFVDADGTVFHKGVEQPKLKGTLPPTPKPEPKKKLSKQEKQTLKNKLAEQMVFIRGELGKAKLKKDIRSNQSSLRKIERQLKKLI